MFFFFLLWIFNGRKLELGRFIKFMACIKPETCRFAQRIFLKSRRLTKRKKRFAKHSSIFDLLLPFTDELIGGTFKEMDL